MSSRFSTLQGRSAAPVKQAEHPAPAASAVILPAMRPAAPRPESVGIKSNRVLDARDPRCGQDNEAMELGFEFVGPDGRTHRALVRQVAGAIARRIVCPQEPGAQLARGERFGMIKYGSYTELYLPKGLIDGWKVKVGDKVKGGLNVVAELQGSRAS